MSPVACRTCGNTFERTHGRQKYCRPECKPSDYRMVTVTCDCCGKAFERAKREPRYAGTFCSYLCRDYARWGALSHEWPKAEAKIRQQTLPRSPAFEPARRACAWCETPFIAKRRDSRFCMQQCKRHAKKVRRRGRENDAPGEYTWAQVVRLWLKFDRSCAYCAEPVALLDVQAEHVTPLSRGGRNDMSNLLPSCMPCNADKRDLLLHEWTADRTRRGLTPRNATWQPDDTRYWHLIQPDLVA